MVGLLEMLTVDHDVRLVVLAAAVCAFGAASTMNVASRAAAGRGAVWHLLLGVCAGATVWATHFIAMLAYRPALGTSYDAVLTALSFGLGAVVMGVGFLLAIRGGARTARLVGGATVGLGVVLLHFVGMAGLRFAGHLTHTPVLVGLSVGLALVLGCGAVALGFGGGRHGLWSGALLLVMTVVSLHFTAMSGVHVVHDATAHAAGGVSRSTLAIVVAVVALLVLLIGMTGAVLDQRLSRRLAAEAERFRTLADGAFEGLIVQHAGMMVDANAAARRMFGLPQTLRGVSLADWIVADGGDPLNPTLLLGDTSVEVTMRRHDGSVFPAEICRRPMRLPVGDGELFAIRDLTARKESEARIAHLALHDPLTDMANRRLFMQLAQKAVSLSQRTGERFALLALDLDDFKFVNDLHGHAAGDELIRAVAQRIMATLREEDVAARFGGDEFAILQTGATQPKHAAALAERLLEALRTPVSIDGVEVALTVSVGVALFPDDGPTAEDLLRNADTALYRAKADGKATCCFFEPQMDADLVARRRLETKLRRAVAEDLLTIAYQPIVNSATRQAVGFEALVRWHDAELGNITPGEFIPIAEETGLIVQIGESILRRACLEAVGWPDPLRVAVNLSAVQFKRRGLVEMVQAALADSGLPGNRLELEITETLLIENRDQALRTLRALKEIGVRISMDDFGTGYSSLSYLQSFPFDKLKIDRVFVSDLPGNTQNASIVRAVAAMGRSLQMRVVAEGVETGMQADMVKGLDCDEMQGFYIARPMPPDRVAAFLKEQAVGAGDVASVRDET